jgi:hypothetical protein
MGLNIRQLRRYQLGLVLIGIALAKDGDDELIDAMNKDALGSVNVRWCLDAIKKNRGKDVRGFFRALGVNCGRKRVIEAIIDGFQEEWERKQLERTLVVILEGNLVKDLDTAEKRLEAALATIRNAKSKKVDLQTTVGA